MTLTQRLEDATGGTRELNIALGQALGLIDDDLIYTMPDGSRCGRGNCDPWPDWTDSVDCALALAERLWPHVMWRVGHEPSDGSLLAELVTARKPGDAPASKAHANTAPLALCLAILKAKATASPDTGEGG